MRTTRAKIVIIGLGLCLPGCGDSVRDAAYGAAGALTSVYAGVPLRADARDPALADRLREVARRAENGEMAARLRVAGFLDLARAGRPSCDEMARERADLVRNREFKTYLEASVAIAQLGELRESAFARRALIEMAADSRCPDNLRAWALAAHSAHLRGDPEAPAGLTSRRPPTRRELAVYWSLAVSNRWRDREAALSAIALGEVVELKVRLLARLRSLKSKPQRSEIYRCLLALDS